MASGPQGVVNCPVVAQPPRSPLPQVAGSVCQETARLQVSAPAGSSSFLWRAPLCPCSINHS